MPKTAIRSAARCAAFALFAFSSSAFAQKTPAGMGTQGSLTVSADRLFGVLFSSVYTESKQGQGTVERSERSTNIVIVNGQLGVAGPRVGLDYTVIPNLTIGAAFGLGFGSSSDKTKAGSTETKTDGPSSFSVLIAPRVGYMIDLSDTLGVWPRGGITYFRSSLSSDNPGPHNTTVTRTDTFQQVSATIDVPLVISPADHFAFTAGPFLDFPLTSSGKFESEGVSKDFDPAPKVTNLGLAFGLLGSF